MFPISYRRIPVFPVSARERGPPVPSRSGDQQVLHGPGAPVQSVPLVHCDGAGHTGATAHEPAPVQNVSHKHESAH